MSAGRFCWENHKEYGMLPAHDVVSWDADETTIFKLIPTDMVFGEFHGILEHSVRSNQSRFWTKARCSTRTAWAPESAARLVAPRVGQLHFDGRWLEHDVLELEL